MKVKVCGIKSYQDAEMVLDQGVDALGFNFYSLSPRYISPAEARDIIRRLPPFAQCVGLFVDADRDSASEIARFTGIQIVQLHGNESPEYCRTFAENWPVIKALRIGSGPLEENLGDYPVRAFLLDAKDDLLFGGTGKTFDWSRAEAIRSIRPVVLAGGLRPDNVSDAIRTVSPYAVDVCSGVESAPGKKDRAKLIEFMNEVRHAGNSFQRP